jgi:hypothetical protein
MKYLFFNIRGRIMKNILKNNGLGRLVRPVLRSLGVVGLFAIVFVGNLFSMRMTPQQMQRAKLSTKKIMMQTRQQQQIKLQQAINKKVAALEPGECFVYAQGTSDGVVVSWEFLQNSNLIKIMVEDLGNQQEKIAIPLPFSFNTVQKVMQVIVFFNELYDKKAEEKMYDECGGPSTAYSTANYGHMIEMRTKTQQQFKGQKYYSLKAKEALHEFVREKCKNASIDEIVQQANCIDYLDISFITTYEANPDEDPRHRYRPLEGVCWNLYVDSLTAPYEFIIVDFIQKQLRQIAKNEDCYKKYSQSWFGSKCTYDYPKGYRALQNLDSGISKKIIRRLSKSTFHFFERINNKDRLMYSMFSKKDIMSALENNKNLAVGIDSLISQVKDYIAESE